MFSTVLGKCVPITTPSPPPPPPAPTPSPPGKITPFDPSAALLEAYNRLFGKGTVNLGGYKGPTGGGPGGTGPGGAGNVVVPTPGMGGTPGPTKPLPGFTGVNFTPGKPQYFGDVPGSMLPGTLPSNYNPLAAYKGPLATDLLAQNPNLSPSILGGFEGLGYYTDRLGNRIFSPGGGLLRFAEGGEVSEEDADSARAQLQKLLESAPERTQTEVSVSPNARSVKKTTRKSVSSDRGKGISMKMEEARMSSEPSSREQLAAMSEQYKDLLRNTFSKPTLTARGPLTARRFADGGEAVVQPTGRYYGGFTPPKGWDEKQPKDYPSTFAGFLQAYRDRRALDTDPRVTAYNSALMNEEFRALKNNPESLSDEYYQNYVANRVPGLFSGLRAPTNERVEQARDQAGAMALGNRYQDYLNRMTGPFDNSGSGIVRDERLGDDSLSMNVPGFQEGGEAKSQLTELLRAARDRVMGTEAQGPLPKPGPGTRRYFEEKGQALRGSEPTGIEREAQIRSKMGPEYRDLVDKYIGEAAMVGVPTSRWSLKGVNFPIPTAGATEEEMSRLVKRKLAPILNEADAESPPKGKRIFGIGKNAVPQIYAHEFRHEKLDDEEYNRVMDLVNAGSRPAYEDSIDSLYGYYITRDPLYREANFRDQYRLGYDVPFNDKERYVLSKGAGIMNYYLRTEGPYGARDKADKYIQDNYNLNATGTVGATKATGKQLDEERIRQRARYPFLNFVGRENMPVTEEKIPLPEYLDAELKKPSKKKK